MISIHTSAAFLKQFRYFCIFFHKNIRVINRFTIFIGALILILASLFPPLGAFFNSLPQAVLGGCTVMMFGSIMYEGIKMLKNCEFNDHTMIIVSLLLSLLLPKKKQAN